MFVCLFVYKIAQFVQLAAIQLTIQHSSKYLFGFLLMRPDFAPTNGATIFEGKVHGGKIVFDDAVFLGSMNFS